MRINYVDWQQILETKQSLNHHFVKHGCLWVASLEEGFDEFSGLVDSITLRYVNDAVRRKARFGRNQARDVDPGLQEIHLHSESSFSPVCPQVIWFYCAQSDPDLKAPTTVCDGIEVWKKLSMDAKHFFLTNPIEYHLSVELPQKLRSTTWFLNRLGCGKADIVDGNRLEFISRRFAVNELISYDGQVVLSFANHLLVPLESEPQLIARTYNAGKRIPQDLEHEYLTVCSEQTEEIEWRTGDMLMLDNRRFMHGRRPIPQGAKRDIVIMQSEFVRF